MIINKHKKDICGFCYRVATRVCFCNSLDDNNRQTVFICDNANCLEKANKELKIVSVFPINMPSVIPINML